MRKQQHQLIKFLFLLNGLVCIFASSCSYTGLASGTKITSGSPQAVLPSTLLNWPASTTAISMALTVTFDDACSAGQTFNVLSLNIKPSGSDENILNFAIDCDSLKMSITGTYLNAPMTTASAMFSSSTLGAVSIAFAMSLDTKLYSAELQTQTGQDFGSDSFTITQAWTFDSLTKINICSGQNGASPKGCTVNSFYVFDNYFTSSQPTAYSTMTTPGLFSFYALLEGSLDSADGSVEPAYFGDSSATPSSGSTPKWSKNFVSITADGQYLSVPLPNSFGPSTKITASSLSISAWVKISSIPNAEATIFALHEADGTQLSSIKLTIDQTLGVVSLSTGDQTTTGPTVSLNEWHLIGFTLSLKKGLKGALGAVFVDSEVTSFSYSALSTAIDLSAAAVLRVGGSTNSFIGNVLGIRMTTPGGGYIPASTCSASNALEMGLGSFPLLCAAQYKLNAFDNTCVQECPSEMKESSSAPITICLPDFNWDVPDKKLSPGIIAAIAVGCVVFFVGIFIFMRFAYKNKRFCFKGRKKTEEKIYEVTPESRGVKPMLPDGAINADADDATP